MILRLAMRNATRNVRRSMLTATTVVLSVALLTLAMAWIEGVFSGVYDTSTASIGHVRVVDPDYAARERLMPLYENIQPVGPVVDAIRGVEGVVGAYPILRVGVAVTGSDELGDAFGLAVGAPTELYAGPFGVEEAIIEGSFFTGGPDEIVLGRKLAKKASAEVGGEVLLLGQTQDGSISPIKGTVVGIASAGYGLVDNQAFVPLEKIQWLADIEDGALEILVYGAHHDDAAAIDAALEALPALDGLKVEAFSERPPWSEFTGIIGAIQGVLGMVFVFIAALAIWNTMMMSVLERTAEIGVMRAMGLTRVQTVVLFVVEAMVIAALGAVVGVALGAIPGFWLETHGFTIGSGLMDKMGDSFAVSETIYADMNASIAVRGLVIGLLMAFAGAFVPSLRAASVQPVNAMRTGR